MDNIGLFDLTKLADDGSLLLLPWAQAAYGLQTSDELEAYLDAEDKASVAAFERLMAEMDEQERSMVGLEFED